MPAARLTLISPRIADGSAFAGPLAAACRAGDVAAVLLRLGAADERALVDAVKHLAPLAQEGGAAVLVAVDRADPVTVATRGGADGVHVPRSALTRELRERLKSRALGVGDLRSRHDAMEAGEAEVDYVMFGEPRPDGSSPALETVLERAQWWAEIFEVPCIACAPTLDAVPGLAATGAEFVALGEAVWSHPDGPAAAVAAACERLAAEDAGR